MNSERFKPSAIIQSGTSALDVTGYVALGSPDSYEYYINSDSGNKMTRSGVLWISRDTRTVTFTANTTLEVM